MTSPATTTTFSPEYTLVDRHRAPLYTDACPDCDGYSVAPYDTRRTGRDGLVAFYRHQRCGHQWSCRWQVQQAA